jgi:alanyl-tRNA synthetase
MLTQEELSTIGGNVIRAIRRNYPVIVGHTSLEDAKGRGAMALFGEKYGDVVRTIEIGDPADRYSLELCGGTHVKGTAEIGSFRIISEGSVGANLRRVEAVTGRHLEVFVGDRIQVLDRAAAHLNVSPTEVDDRVLGLLDEVQAGRRELARLQRAAGRQGFERLMATNVQDVAGLPVLTAVTDGATVVTLREMADWFRAKVGSGVAALGTVVDDRPLLIVAVTPDLVERGLRAGDLIRPAAKLIGGGGGGKPTLAQAGGRDKSRLQEAVALVPQLVADAVRDGKK